MGFDNECVLNIQSLPGEYFCPVCRTLIYPNEALQSQCTHLYCKPCLAYIVATTHACPYDGYLVTEADSKPLMESNKTLAETIGKVAVHCLYHRSGCQWQGGLSDCITHCAECTFGNSAVICNRCGTQIMHRQVQEHGQTCAGVSQTPQVEGQSQDPKAQGQASAQDQQSTTAPAAVPVASIPATTAAPAASASAITSIPAPAAATAATGQGLPQGNNAAYAQTAAQAPTPEQWYQQQQQQQLQYQQYYQYHGYDPYQQQYQQYAQYQQQAYAQYGQPQVQVAPQQAIQGGQQPQQYMVAQPYPQHQAQPQPQLQPQSHPQAQPVPQQQPQAHPVPQQQTQAQPAPQALAQAQPVPLSQPQAQVLQQPPQQHQAPHSQQQLPLQPQPQAHAQHPLQAHQFHAHVQQTHQQAPPQTHAPPHSQLPGQQLLQPQPHHPQPQTHHQVQPQQLQAPPHQPQPVPQQQPPHSQMQHLQPQLQQQSYPQHQSQPRPQLHPQSQLQQPPNQLQPHPTSQPQSFPQPQVQHPSAHAVTGHQSFPQPQPQQQIPPGPPQHRPMQALPQQQQTQHPLQSHNQFPPQQPPPMRPSHTPQLPMQVQQQPTMMPPQGPHTSLHPAQQQGQRPVQQQGQQIHQHPAVQPLGQQQGLPQQQAHAQLHPGHPHSQGAFPPPQQVPHPQQAIRPHGQAYMQQQIPIQPHLQQNSMPAMSGPQAQPGPGRPMLPPQQPLHQSPATHATVVKAGMNQQSPQARPAGRLSSVEAQPGSMLQNQIAQPSSHDGLLSASPASRPGVESKTLKSENDLKSTSNEGAPTSDTKEKDQPINDGKDVKDSATPRDVSAHIESHKKDENVEEPADKKGETGDSVIGKIEKSEVSKGAQGQVEPAAGETIENPSQKVSHQLPDGTGTAKSQIDSTKVAELESLNSIPQNASQNFAASQGQTSGINANTIQPQQFPHQRNQLHELPAHGTSFSQPTGPLDGPQGVPHMNQRPPAPGRMFPEHMHHSGSTVGRSFPDHPHEMALRGQPPVPISTVQKFPEMLPPQGHPMSVAPEPFQTPVAKQPQGPWRPEVPHSHLTGLDPNAPLPRGPPQFGHIQKSFEEQTLVPQGQNPSRIPPSHDTGPRNFSGENYGQPFMSGPPPPGPEAYATKRQPEIIHPLPSEHPQFGPPPHGRSNAMIMNNGGHDSGFTHGLPNERFGPSPMERFKPFHEDGFNAPPDERFTNSGMDIGARAVSRRDFEEDLKQFPRPSHLDDGYNTSSRPPFGSSRPLDKVPYASDGGPNALTSRPLPPHQPSGSFPTISGGPQLRPMDIGGRPALPGLHEDIGRRNDSSTHIGSRMDSLPPFRSPGREYTDPFSNRYGSGTRSHMDDFNGTDPRGFGDQSKTFNFPPDSVRSALQESKIPGLPSSSLPGYFRRGDHDGPGNIPMAGHMGSGNLIDPTRKDMDGPETFPNRFGPSEPRNISSGEFSPHNLPGHLRGGESLGQGQMRMGESISFGGIPRHLRMEDPIGSIQLPSHLRAGERIGGGNFGGHMNVSEPGFSSSFLKHNFPSEAKNSSPGLHGDLDSFERSRGRKPGSMGWCRICKIDCVSVEGLDLHSQSREHQTMTMDLVLSIKQENTKRQKLSGGNMSHDDTNKMRQAAFENRMN